MIIENKLDYTRKEIPKKSKSNYKYYKNNFEIYDLKYSINNEEADITLVCWGGLVCQAEEIINDITEREEIIVEMFKLHPKSSARQIAVAVQNKLKCTTTIPVSMIKHIRTTLWQKSVENAKHALKTLPQLVLKYNHCDNDNVMTIKTHTVENGDVQYDGVFCIPGQSMRISKSGVIRMLGAMDAAHCTFPLTRGILIDFGIGSGN